MVWAGWRNLLASSLSHKQGISQDQNRKPYSGGQKWLNPYSSTKHQFNWNCCSRLMFAIEAIMKFWDDANTQGKGLRAKECAFWGDYLPHLLKKGKLPIILKTFSSTNKVNITPILFKKWFRRHLGNLAQKCSCTPQRKGK